MNPPPLPLPPQIKKWLELIPTLKRAASYGLTNGGTGGVIWVSVGVLVGALAMVASIAEMASMSATHLHIWFQIR